MVTDIKYISVSVELEDKSDVEFCDVLFKKMESIEDYKCSLLGILNNDKQSYICIMVEYSIPIMKKDLLSLQKIFEEILQAYGKVNTMVCNEDTYNNTCQYIEKNSNKDMLRRHKACRKKPVMKNEGYSIKVLELEKRLNEQKDKIAALSCKDPEIDILRDKVLEYSAKILTLECRLDEQEVRIAELESKMIKESMSEVGTTLSHDARINDLYNKVSTINDMLKLINKIVVS